MLRPIKQAAIRRLGLGPVLNRRQQLRHLPVLPGLLLHERREARAAGEIAAAELITIVPTIGRDTLVSAVESALAQSVAGHRVVVVSDGPHALPALPDQVVVLRTSTRCGVVGVVRNIAMRATRSPLLAFLDDDNRWHDGHLASCLATLERTGADIVYSSAVRVREDGTRYDTIGRPWDRDAIRRANYVDASAIVLRRHPGLRFSRTPRLNNFEFSEDWELVWRESRSRRVAWTGTATIDYAISPSMLAALEVGRAGGSRVPR